MPANQLFQFVVAKAISLSAVLRRGAVLAPRDFADLVGTPALGKVVTFRLAAVAALEVARFAQHVEGELHVLRRERLAVVPLHVLAEEEDEVAVVVLPRPALGELGSVNLIGVVQREATAYNANF
mgnify:CR=1 FL=1